MLSLGPLRRDNDTVLVAVRKRAPAVAAAPPAPVVAPATNASFEFLSLSLDRRRCATVQSWWSDPRCRSSAAEFYAAVLDHALDWAAAFSTASGGAGRGDTALRLALPYAERRQADSARP